MNKMAHAPVYYTLAQVKFNPLYALDKFAPEIQDNFRKAGFPGAQKTVQALFNIDLNNVANEAGGSQMPVSQIVRHDFFNKEKTAGFMLMQNSLLFQTTDYDVFNVFLKTFLQGLSIVHEIVKLDYSERIGLRYLDMVFPKSGEHLSDYLKDCMLGLNGKIAGDLIHSFSETATRVDKETVISRAVAQKGPIGFPPDLQPITLSLPERFRALDGVHAVLDNDGSFGEQQNFDLSIIAARLESIHKNIGQSFEAMVTPHALKVWG